jgi:hypothetical protein
MAESRRDAILETVKLSLEAIVANEAVDDPYKFQFSSVVRGPLPNYKGAKRLVAGLYPIEEAKVKQLQFTECQLQFSVDFLLSVNTGDSSPANEVEAVIAIIQRRIMFDSTLNGLVIDTVEIGNQVNLDTAQDKTAEGSVFFVVQYRHDHNDTRTYFGVFAPTPTATLTGT